MIQCQQFPDHIVHLRRLIHNDLTIEITAFCIVIDTFFQSFCISLDQCDRRFQLMRDIGKKFFSHLVDLDLFFDIILQLIIRCFQLRNRPFQRLGHLVEMLAQLTNLILSAARIFCVKIKVCHAFGKLCQFLQRRRYLT